MLSFFTLAAISPSRQRTLRTLLVQGALYPADIPTLLVVPFVWGAVTGLGLTAWAYEPAGVRRWGERVVGALILLYLIVGVLAAEHLPIWLSALPDSIGRRLYWAFEAFHEYNPFGVMRFAMEQTPAWARARIEFVEMAGLILAAALLARAASRLQGHFQDWHYKPVLDVNDKGRPAIGDG